MYPIIIIINHCKSTHCEVHEYLLAGEKIVCVRGGSVVIDSYGKR